MKAQNTANNGDIGIAGSPGEEATVKTFSSRGDRVTLTPSNPRLEPMVFEADEIAVYGKVVTVMRRL